MRPSAFILSTGSELSSGRSIDTNAPHIAAALADLGWRISGLATLPDDKEILVHGIRHFLQRSDVQLLVMTGGLGPTSDDHTVDVLASLADRPAVVEEEALRKVELLAKRMKRSFDNDALRRQVRIVEGAQVLINKHGLAPGMLLDLASFGEDTRVAAMPGVPQEMTAMLKKQLLPKLKEIYQFPAPHRVGMHVYTIGESTFQSQVFGGKQPGQTALEKNGQDGPLIPSEDLPADFDWGITAGRGQLKIFLESGDQGKLEELKERIYEFHKGFVLPEAADLLLHNHCRQKELQLATAESCTGGMIGKLLTDRSGSSSYYKGGVVAYSNELKQKLLDVPRELLEQHGAVSSQCAEAMARGALLQADSHYAVAVTGIAGPSGGTREKPVGTIYIGLARCFPDADKNKEQSKKNENIKTEHRHLFLPLDRGRVRDYTAHLALFHLYQFIQSHS